ncbi:MAG: formylglycine-generating enzyme family protein [Anaerolineales bacterium]
MQRCQRGYESELGCCSGRPEWRCLPQHYRETVTSCVGVDTHLKKSNRASSRTSMKMAGTRTRVMKKDIVWLISIVLCGVILSACNTQKPELTSTFEPVSTLFPTATNTSGPTNTHEATVTFTPTPPDMPILDPTIRPAATAVPIFVETEQSARGSTRISEVDQMIQVYVPAGEFIMGSTDVEAQITLENGRAYPEIPVNTVYLDGYWIDKYEVSNGQYALCVDAGVCQPPYLSSSETRTEYFNNPEYSNYPVIWVSWYMARAYCEWTGRRLPTEAEWEKAARGTDGRKYPWGDDPLGGKRANFCDINCPRTIANPIYDDGYPDTSPVGNYPAGASPYGAMDMSGNVWEWTGTLIQPYPYDAADGREDLDVYGERVWRGGPWSNGYWWMRSSVRYRSIPSYWYVNLGIRCASSE